MSSSWFALPPDDMPLSRMPDGAFLFMRGIEPTKSAPPPAELPAAAAAAAAALEAKMMQQMSSSSSAAATEEEEEGDGVEKKLQQQQRRQLPPPHAHGFADYPPESAVVEVRGERVAAMAREDLGVLFEPRPELFDKIIGARVIASKSVAFVRFASKAAADAALDFGRSSYPDLVFRPWATGF